MWNSCQIEYIWTSWPRGNSSVDNGEIITCFRGNSSMAKNLQMNWQINGRSRSYVSDCAVPEGSYGYMKWVYICSSESVFSLFCGCVTVDQRCLDRVTLIYDIWHHFWLDCWRCLWRWHPNGWPHTTTTLLLILTEVGWELICIYATHQKKTHKKKKSHPLRCITHFTVSFSEFLLKCFKNPALDLSKRALSGAGVTATRFRSKC